MTRYVVATITALLCVALVTGCSKDEATEEDGQMQQQTDAEKILITVNDETITDADVAEEVSRLLQMRSRGMSPQDLESARREMRGEAAENIVSRMLLEEQVEEQNIEVPDEQVAERLKIIKENFGSEEVFQARIGRMNMTEDDVRREIATGMSIERLIETQTASLAEPSEAALREYYNEHIDRYTEPDKIRASHILVTVNPADDEQTRAQKLETIEEVLEKARGGANFAQLAVQHSDCPSKSRGGDLDFFARGQMVKEFETAAFALDVGGMSDIVETKFGYHIIKLTDRKESRVVPFEEALERVKNDYTNESKQRVINEYLERLKAAAQITYADSSLME